MNPGSCLYECTVMHRRISPKEHRFVYRIFLFCIDLDELQRISRRIPFFSHNSPNLYSLRDEDYFLLSSGGLRLNVEAFLESEGFAEKPARILLLTLPRLLGYTFNPVSIFYCFDMSDRPLCSVVQVGNTFGELKPFFVPLVTEKTVFHRRATKNFYVSPFSDLDLVFDFRFDLPGDRLGVWINDFAGSDKTLVSSLTGRRLELNAANLAWLSLKYPLITLKVIGLIHWEALRLWWKRIPFRLKETRPDLQTGVFRARPEPTVSSRREHDGG